MGLDIRGEGVLCFGWSFRQNVLKLFLCLLVGAYSWRNTIALVVSW